jgi:serine/threonine-protein kinase
MSDDTISQGPQTLGGRYQLAEMLGHGGMAEVRKAQDTRLDRAVAIKMLRPDLARDATFQARFRREAQSAASLNAPSVVAVYDTGEDTVEGARVPYIVMEYVEGQTLRDLLRNGERLLPTRALEITDGVLAALDYSHRNGIIHRDVKPANVMLDSSGQVKVMDFGIARAVADSGATMTQTANVLGTAQYLSPEQARGEVVDARSDLYSTGCLLYELLANRPPFQGESPVAVAYQHVRENPIPPSTINPDVTPDMDAIVMKALAKNPDNRYQTAAEMRSDIQRALQGGTVAAPPVLAEPMTQPIHAINEDEEPNKRKTAAYIALIVGVVLVLALLAWAAWALFGGGAKSVRIDDVTGKPLAEAIQIIEDQGLVVGDRTPQPSEEKKNTVLAQNPPANTEVEEGSTVDLTFSSGPEQVTVPELRGLPQSEAIDRLQTAGLQVGEITSENSDQPAGTVLSSNPEEGRQVDKGDAVDLVISTGEVEVPKVVGKTESEARAILTSEGFEADVLYEETDQATAGTVISQIPAAGSTASRGTVVTITVATEPPTPTPTETTTSPTPEESSPGNSGNNP